jgi:hypothetical protein
VQKLLYHIARKNQPRIRNFSEKTVCPCVPAADVI